MPPPARRANPGSRRRAEPEDYVELRCRSAFSFLEAASDPEALIECAAALDYPALALGDRAGVYGIPRFHRAARSAGLRAIVGAELRVALSAPDGDASAPAHRDVLLLVENARGYRNLSRLLTLGHAKTSKGAQRPRSEPQANEGGPLQNEGELPGVTWQELEKHAQGLTALVRGDAALTSALLDRAQALFPHRRLWVDISRGRTRAAEAANQRAVDLAEAAGVPLVASNDVRHARPEDRRLLDALTCLREKTSLDRAGRRLAPNAERHLRPRHEMVERFADRPEWIRATREISERCAFTLKDLDYRFPEFPIPPGETQHSLLRILTLYGARERYGTPPSRRVREQLEHELSIIEKLDLAGYFLIVHDIARFAREEEILAQGRGSAANSAVCYALGITAVDPIAMDLLFERFLSEERGEWPDIDIDLPSGAQREKVIQYVFEKYGAHGAAMTAVVISYRTRLAVREMGKVLDLAPDSIERISKLMRSVEHPDDPETRDAALRQANVDPDAPRIATLLELVDAVRGLPRHLSQHTGGIVIAAGRLDEVVPIEPARMLGRRVVQWDKEDCADLGIIKIDLLGLGMLAAIEDTIELIHRHENADLDLAHLPPDDPQTYAMIRNADTIGTFQIESRAQMATLPRMKPERFYDLVVEVAIIRPGPITGKMVHPYLERRAGRAPVTYPHPSLEPILERTLGVPLFQEQLLRIAMTAAGFSGGEAEELRRAMGFKRSVERMNTIERRLVEGMTSRGFSEEAREEILRGITSFALYGFPESHAASFALIAYASAYLKCHHPAAFLAGLLNAQPMGFYSPATLVKDAQRHGIEVRAIDPTRSDWRCTLESPRFETHVRRHPRDATQPDEEDRNATHRMAVRVGLRHVTGLREKTGLRIAAERRRAPFANVADLAQRAALRRTELDALAELGALAALAEPNATPHGRRSALWQVAAIERDPNSLFADVSPADDPSPLIEMNDFETTLADYRHSGLTLGPHPLQHLRADLARRGVLSAAQLRDVPDGKFVRTAGHAIVRQRPGTAKGFCFLTLEDETGISNAILTPSAFRRFRVPLHAAAILEIAGPLQNLDGVIHVRVRELRPLAHRCEVPHSHDYR